MAGFVFTATLGGCSADLGRFDSVGLGGDGSHARQAPIPHEPLRRNAGVPITPSEPEPSILPPPSPGPVRQAGLPEPVFRDGEPRRQMEPLRSEPPRSGRALPAAPRTSPKPVTTGATIEVKSGDTIYGLAKHHKVSIAELMSANGLQNPTIRPGQRLVLPASGRRAVPARRNEKLVAAAPAATQPTRVASAAPTAATLPPLASDAAASAPSDWNGTHTVTPRDSLYAIARHYKVKVAELQSVNGITEPSKLRAGTVLKVPGHGSGRDATRASDRTAAGSSDAQSSPPRISAPASGSVGSAGHGLPTAGAPKIINSNPPAEPAERVATATPRSPVANDATPEPAPAIKEATPKPAAAGTTRFRWPAKGRVIANFGPRTDNTHNDGINILVPQGSDVVAAESGTVAYAGSELKGYGNLLLIRHEGNWVSAYAHNETLLVKRGDKVARGQPIAKAGKTGAVEQPQVHFELRQGSKPVDPMPHLEK